MKPHCREHTNHARGTRFQHDVHTTEIKTLPRYRRAGKNMGRIAILLRLLGTATVPAAVENIAGAGFKPARVCGELWLRSGWGILNFRI